MWDEEHSRYVETKKLSNGQTVMMGFDLTDWNGDTNYWNIELSVYNKRKDQYSNMDKIVVTGGSPFESFAAAREMFHSLLYDVLNEYGGYDNVIYCSWVDNRRRDAYYKYLSKYGFTYTNLWGQKFIARKFKKDFDYSDFVNEV